MDTLTSIEASLSDYIAIITTPNEVIPHSCQSATTAQDLYVVATICITIIIALLITAITVGYCINKTNKAHLTKLEKRNNHELYKLGIEYSWKERKDRYYSAWRTIEHSWKERSEIVPSDNGKENNCIDSTVNKAWSYIKYFWGNEMNQTIDNTPNNQKSKS